MFDVDEFVNACDAALAESEPQLAVRDIVARAVSSPHELEQAFGEPTAWGVEVLHNDDRFTVIHFVWPPTLRLFPHEHKMWSTVGIYGGVEDNTFYRRVENGIVESGGRSASAGDVVMLGSDPPSSSTIAFLTTSSSTRIPWRLLR